MLLIPELADVLPPSANDNNPLLYEGWTPQAALTACRKAREELIGQSAREGSVPVEARTRRMLILLDAFEACLRWHHFRS